MGRKVPMWQCILAIVAMIVFLFWTASPVTSHLIGRLELTTNEELNREVKLWKR